jgi:hypothetical protein
MTFRIPGPIKQLSLEYFAETTRMSRNIRNLFRSEGQFTLARAKAFDCALIVVSWPPVYLGSLMNRSGYWPELPLIVRAHTSETFDVTAYAPLLNLGLMALTGKSRPVTSGVITLGLGVLRKFYQYQMDAYGPHSHYRFDSTAFLTLSAAMYIGGHLAYKKFSERPPSNSVTKLSSSESRPS